MCVGGGGGGRPLFVPTPLTPVAPPPPPDQIDLSGMPTLALMNLMNQRQGRADTQAGRRRRMAGATRGKRMMTIPTNTTTSSSVNY